MKTDEGKSINNKTQESQIKKLENAWEPRKHHRLSNQKYENLPEQYRFRYEKWLQKIGMETEKDPKINNNQEPDIPIPPITLTEKDKSKTKYPDPLDNLIITTNKNIPNLKLNQGILNTGKEVSHLNLIKGNSNER